jgi:hypothetical protein
MFMMMSHRLAGDGFEEHLGFDDDNDVDDDGGHRQMLADTEEVTAKADANSGYIVV